MSESLGDVLRNIDPDYDDRHNSRSARPLLTIDSPWVRRVDTRAGRVLISQTFNLQTRTVAFTGSSVSDGLAFTPQGALERYRQLREKKPGSPR